MIDNAKTGFVVPIGDYRSVAAALIRCLDIKQHDQLAANARRAARARFEPSLVADHTIDAYLAILANGERQA